LFLKSFFLPIVPLICFCSSLFRYLFQLMIKIAIFLSSVVICFCPSGNSRSKASGLMKILGINSVYHESAAALLVDGQLRCFVEEERINRCKRGKRAELDNPHHLPEASIRACLDYAGLAADEIDCFAFSFAESGRLQNIGVDRYLEPDSWGTAAGEKLFHSSLQKVPEQLARIAGSGAARKLVWCEHHLAHAASAFYCSPFSEALVVVIDGIGEFDSITAYHGHKNSLRKVFSLPYPHSLGFLWEKFCVYLGFSEHDACKLMGLSSYGNPAVMAEKFAAVARLDTAGIFRIDNDVTRFRSNDTSALESIFGPARKAGEPITGHHWNIAASLQDFTEKALLALLAAMQNLVPSTNLCLAGGTALNCVANTVIAREKRFSGIFVQPAANDAGTALGAALQVAHGLNDLPRRLNMDHSLWGPDFTEADILNAIAKTGFKAVKSDNPAKEAAKQLDCGKIVGWFQGRMETGPRALGNRSLLADPRRRDMREILNRKIKHREDFRPFAPSVLAEQAAEWFDIPMPSVSSDFMLFAYPGRPEKIGLIPAVVHVDGTSRIQTVSKATNPRYHAMISEFFRLTGVPMVLNTSFNDSEPIVMTPSDALHTFSRTGIDVLVLGDYIICKEAQVL
jgi:carbamoyltransferase